MPGSSKSVKKTSMSNDYNSGNSDHQPQTFIKGKNDDHPGCILYVSIPSSYEAHMHQLFPSHSAGGSVE